MSKHKLDDFFKPQPTKKPRVESAGPPSRHTAYPFPIPQLPQSIEDGLDFSPAEEGKAINDKPRLDILYFQPYVDKAIEKHLFEFLRNELPFYRVKYTIKRGPVETQINTPRYTTVFGVDDSSQFSSDGSLLDSKGHTPAPKDRYKCKPRPIPDCLDKLRKVTEGSTGDRFNFCLVNYYASGSDSISYHSDDERFLGPNPSIASFSLGSRRDFLMKPKQQANTAGKESKQENKPLKFPLASGDMILMRGPTQSNWLHSIPKRKGMDNDCGRINITFRRALARGGTENYYQYNVGSGGVYKWDGSKKEMVAWNEPTAK